MIRVSSVMRRTCRDARGADHRLYRGLPRPSRTIGGVPTAARRIRQELVRRLAGVGSLADQVAAADELLRKALGADVSAWGTIDPATTLSTSCAVFGEFHEGGKLAVDERARERHLFELEWQDRDPNTVGDMLRQGRTAAGLRADVPDLRAVQRHRELLAPLGVVDELRLLCVAEGLAWSTVFFYRTSGGPFEPRDVEVATAASAPLARAFRHAMLQSACESTSLVEPPGALLVGADGSIITTSAAAEALLSSVDERAVTTTITGLLTRTDSSSLPTARLAGRSGLLALHASPAKGIDGAVSVVVERPRRLELAPLMMLAFGFTGREREVLEQALAGAGRGAIARHLGVAEDTVGDHLTNAYRKAGVGSRAELSALLFGRFYDDPRSRHVPPGPYGYFLGPT